MRLGFFTSAKKKSMKRFTQKQPGRQPIGRQGERTVIGIWKIANAWPERFSEQILAIHRGAPPPTTQAFLSPGCRHKVTGAIG